ncbi:MAG: MFS transporter, partial [Pseudomonadales bacterium]
MSVLSRRTIYTHGALGMPLAIIGYPLSIWIPAHYSGGLGLSLAAVGTILMLARFTDVITDPLIGELSDRTRTRFGRRKPWILLGTPLMTFSVWQLFVPAEGVGLGYFLLWLTLFFVGSTLVGLPHRAWGAELSVDYHERSRITAAREFYILTGLMIAAAVPMV